MRGVSEGVCRAGEGKEKEKMTKAGRYKVRLRVVLQQKIGITQVERNMRKEGLFCTRMGQLYAAVGDSGGLLVPAGWELQPEAVPEFIIWLKETFIDEETVTGEATPAWVR